MKIEVGKQYRMREGGTVEVTTVRHGGSWPYIGYLSAADGRRGPGSWSPKGFFSAGEHDFDLVAEVTAEDEKQAEPDLAAIRVEPWPKQPLAEEQKTSAAPLQFHVTLIDAPPDLQLICALDQVMQQFQSAKLSQFRRQLAVDWLHDKYGTPTA